MECHFTDLPSPWPGLCRPPAPSLGSRDIGADVGGRDEPGHGGTRFRRDTTERGWRAMSALLFRLVLAGAVSAVVPLAQAQLLTHRDLSYAIAKTIAETAIDSCKAKGYAVSAVVVDRAGEVIIAMRADNAGPHTMENARRKAYTARSFRTSTTAYAKRFADNDPVVRQQ